MSRKVLYLEPVGGIAGDMFLAAALDLGVAREDLSAHLKGLGLEGYRIEVSRAERHAITGTHVDVAVDSAKAAQEHRSLREIKMMIEGASTMPARARERALKMFQLIGEAEAKIHDVDVEEIHFHEVGAVDSIVDICGAAVALELLGDPDVFAGAPPLGSGTAKTAHGVIPVPAPATLEILRDEPVRFEGMGELTTPTGAAILKACAKIGSAPEMIIEHIGYGVGTRDFPDRANVLRASLGRPAHAGAEGTFVIEANVDDCSPQLLGSLLEGVIDKGALDAYVTPATMKKSRPGHLVGVVVPADKRDAIAQWLLSESTTIGVRWHRVERFALDRAFETVQTRFGPIRVKVARHEGTVVNAYPEFEDCRAAAATAAVPVKVVWAEAVAAYHRR